jgi:hypothetical protein
MIMINILFVLFVSPSSEFDLCVRFERIAMFSLYFC